MGRSAAPKTWEGRATSVLCSARPSDEFGVDLDGRLLTPTEETRTLPLTQQSLSYFAESSEGYAKRCTKFHSFFRPLTYTHTQKQAKRTSHAKNDEPGIASTPSSELFPTIHERQRVRKFKCRVQEIHPTKERQYIFPLCMECALGTKLLLAASRSSWRLFYYFFFSTWLRLFFLDLDILSMVAWCARTSFVYLIFSVVRTLCSPAV